jgi:hypothetical protein
LLQAHTALDQVFDRSAVASDNRHKKGAHNIHLQIVTDVFVYTTHPNNTHNHHPHQRTSRTFNTSPMPQPLATRHGQTLYNPTKENIVNATTTSPSNGTPYNSAPPTPNTTPHITTHAKALPLSNTAASAASNRAFQPLPPPTAFDRAALSLFSPDHSPLSTPPTTPATTPMCELHLNEKVPLVPLDNIGIPPSKLRQRLLRRRRTIPNVATANADNKASRPAAQQEKEKETWPRVHGPLVFRTLWWCLYALLFTFYVVAGEILPAIQEGVLKASRVFLRAPLEEDTEIEASG